MYDRKSIKITQKPQIGDNDAFDSSTITVK